MKQKNGSRTSMKLGDRVLVNKKIRKEVFIVARVEVPHSAERAFISKSGGDFTIGLRIWKSDYAWNEKNRMWTARR
jgi:hypothetical protein